MRRMGQMKAVVLTGRSGPEVLRSRNDWPRPVPESGEVLVRVLTAAVNNTDIWIRQGPMACPVSRTHGPVGVAPFVFRLCRAATSAV